MPGPDGYHLVVRRKEEPEFFHGKCWYGPAGMRCFKCGYPTVNGKDSPRVKIHCHIWGQSRVWCNSCWRSSEELERFQ